MVVVVLVTIVGVVITPVPVVRIRQLMVIYTLQKTDAIQYFEFEKLQQYH